MRLIPGSSLTALAISIACATPASAQTAVTSLAAQDAPVQVPDDAGNDDDVIGEGAEIIVIAQSLRGTVDTATPPVLELGAEDIAAYGASSIADLISALGDTAGSGRGRGGGFPVILVNGVRIANFRELRSYPPEAIEKVEVFPEEVAQQYGYSADQRVVNLILKKSYASREIELEHGQPFDGGTSTKQAEATLVQIAGSNRLNANIEYERTSPLTEAERDIDPTVSGIDTDPSASPYRSLTAKSDTFNAVGNWTTTIGDTGASLSLNGSFERQNTLRLQGLNSVALTGPGPDPQTVIRVFGEDDPLTVDSRSTTYAGGGAFNTPIGGWQFTATIDGSHAVSTSRIDKQYDTDALVEAAANGTLGLYDPLPSTAENGYDTARSVTDSLNSKATINGRPLYLPAGDVSVTVDTGFDWNRVQREDTRNDFGATALKRGDLNTGINVNVPITSVRDDFGAAIGDLTLQLSGGLDHLSDFGTLYDWSAGFTWSPLDFVTFNTSYISREAAPSLSQLGNPEIETPNVQVFDLSRNETVLATVTTGGNPLLPAEQQSNFKVGAQFQLPIMDNARLSIDYYDDHSDDVAASFPELSPTIEAAFPGRVTRDADGRLIALDQRPVTFASKDSRRIQVGLNLGGAFGAPRQSARSGGGLFGAIRGASGGGASQGGQQGSAQGGQAAQGAAGAGGGQFNRQAFEQMRERLCAADEITPEMLAGLPEQMRGRFLNEDGTVNQQAIAAMRERMCTSDGRPTDFDPARMAAFRTKLCGTDPLTAADLEALPERMRAALLNADGTLNTTQLDALKERVCAQNPAQGEGGEGEARRGNRGGGQFAGGPGGEGGPPAGGAGAGGPPGGGGPGGGGGRGPGGPGGGDGRGRWFLNLNYTYSIEEKVLIAEGGPELDLLNGDATGSGGVARHGASLRGGFFYAGFGLRYDVNYTGKSTLNGTNTSLTFHDYAKIDLRVFADLNERTSLINSVPLLKNTRVSLGVDNVFDARQRVTNSDGTVPLRYQPYLIDPEGRTFEIELRKLF